MVTQNEKVNKLWGDSIDGCEKKFTCTISISIQRELFKSPDLTPLDFLLDEEQSLQKKGGYTGRIVARILDADAGKNKRENHLEKKNAIFAHGL